MNNIILDATATGHRLIVNPTRLSSGSCNVVQIRFYFNDNYDPSWTGLGKTAVFYRKKEEVYHVPLVENIATVPREVLAEEGFFYFGLMGTNGEAIHTTEVVRLTVHQGAITTPTDEAAAFTPNIYEQLLAAHGVTEARLDQLVAMRGTAGESIYPLDGEYITEGSIRVNGCAAAVSFVIDGLTMRAHSAHHTDGNILPEITPLFPKDVTSYFGVIPLHTTHADLTVQIDPPKNEGDWASIAIFNNSDQDVGIYGAHCYGFYNLAAPYLSELADLRVGADGKVYDTAGNAARGENKRLENKVGTAHANAVKRIVTDNPVVITDAAPVSHDVEVQLTSLRALMPAYTRTHDVLDSATEAVVGSAKVIFDAGTTPPVVSVTFNELGVDVGSNTLVIRSNDGLPADLKPYTGTQLAGPNDTIRVILMAAGWISIDTQAITEPITLTGMTYSAHYQLAIFNGADVRRYGKNLFDGRVVKGCHLYADGTFSTSTSYLTNAEKIPIAPEVLHTLSFTLTKGELQGVLFYDKDGAYISSESGHMTNPFTFCPPAGAAFVCFNINAEGIEVEDFQTGQLEVGETATSYEPYAGVETCAINTQGKAVVSSLSPNMTILAHLFDADDNLVLMKTRYNRDLNRVILELMDADKETAREVAAVRAESKNHANAIKGKASGEVVALTDVSPLEHEMAVKLSSSVEPEYTLITDSSSSFWFGGGDGTYTITRIEDYPESDGLCIDFEDGASYMSGVDAYAPDWHPEEGDIVYVINGLPYYISNGGGVVDLSAVTLKKYGKNLCQKSSITSAESVVGFINVTNVKAHGTYTLSADVTVFADDEKLKRFARISVYYTDGTSKKIDGEMVDGETTRDEKPRKFTVSIDTDNTKEIKHIELSPINYTGGGSTNHARADNIQLELSTTATDYEPYHEETYTADENGIVNGIIGNGESMTLLTDTEGVTIEAEYNKDINKVINDIYQKLSALGVAVVNN